jgi:ornithine cyclodeaminase
MTVPVLSDEDVRRIAEMPSAIAAIEGALSAKAEGRLIAPPRHSVKFPEGSLVFTIGGTEAGDSAPSVAGFRTYSTWEGRGERQVTAVWGHEGIKGLVLGNYLGALRTGAIGGVAIKLMSDPAASICGIIGSGLQSETQLRAALAVRPGIRSIRVFSRSAENRRAFAARMSAALGVAVSASESAQAAVEGADIVISATDSAKPVLELSWLKKGAHVNSLGPKFTDAHEMPGGIAARASTIATDAPEQVRAFPSFYLSAEFARLVDLADLVTRRETAARGDITLFVSAGLAGTEVAVADAVLSSVAR